MPYSPAGARGRSHDYHRHAPQATRGRTRKLGSTGFPKSFDAGGESSLDVCTPARSFSLRGPFARPPFRPIPVRALTLRPHPRLFVVSRNHAYPLRAGTPATGRHLAVPHPSISPPGRDDGFRRQASPRRRCASLTPAQTLEFFRPTKQAECAHLAPALRNPAPSSRGSIDPSEDAP